MVKIDNQGQTLIEYVLMLLVVAGLVMFVYRQLGPELNVRGDFIQALNAKFQYTYRHGIDGNKIEEYPPNYASPTHESYSSNGSTRFFGPAETYPN